MTSGLALSSSSGLSSVRDITLKPFTGMRRLYRWRGKRVGTMRATAEKQSQNALFAEATANDDWAREEAATELTAMLEQEAERYRRAAEVVSKTIHADDTRRHGAWNARRHRGKAV